MSRVFFASDPHFRHKNMAYMRHFATVEEHDEHIIKSWNSVVSKRDKVFLLGDITMEKPEYEVLKRLNGSKVVILGNHDRPIDIPELLKYVDKVAGVIKYKGYLLTHVPVNPLEFKYRVKGNIHGHIHELNIMKKSEYFQGLDVIDKRYINVCLERIDFKPKTLEELEEMFN